MLVFRVVIILVFKEVYICLYLVNITRWFSDFFHRIISHARLGVGTTIKTTLPLLKDFVTKEIELQYSPENEHGIWKINMHWKRTVINQNLMFGFFCAIFQQCDSWTWMIDKWCWEDLRVLALCTRRFGWDCSTHGTNAHPFFTKASIGGQYNITQQSSNKAGWCCSKVSSHSWQVPCLWFAASSWEMVPNINKPNGKSPWSYQDHALETTNLCKKKR